MLKLYPVILDFVSNVSPLIGRIARNDPDLARQLRRASTAVAFNTAEGMYARGPSLHVGRPRADWRRLRRASPSAASRPPSASTSELEPGTNLGRLALVSTLADFQNG